MLWVRGVGGGRVQRARRSNVITTISLPNVSGDKCIDVYQYKHHHHLGWGLFWVNSLPDTSFTCHITIYFLMNDARGFFHLQHKCVCIKRVSCSCISRKWFFNLISFFLLSKLFLKRVAWYVCAKRFGSFVYIIKIELRIQIISTSSAS